MTHRGIKAGIYELDELETTFVNGIQDVLYRISNIPEFVDYNNYLGNQLNTKKEGDKKLEKLMLNVKEKKTNDNKNTERNNDNGGIGKEKIRIRRKLQF